MGPLKCPDPSRQAGAPASAGFLRRSTCTAPGNRRARWAPPAFVGYQALLPAVVPLPASQESIGRSPSFHRGGPSRGRDLPPAGQLAVRGCYGRGCYGRGCSSAWSLVLAGRGAPLALSSAARCASGIHARRPPLAPLALLGGCLARFPSLPLDGSRVLVRWIACSLVARWVALARLRGPGAPLARRPPLAASLLVGWVAGRGAPRSLRPRAAGLSPRARARGIPHRVGGNVLWFGPRAEAAVAAGLRCGAASRWAVLPQSGGAAAGGRRRR